MITHISIQDFAIIKELNMDLHSGLNIITGETGAGKSIVIEAISMALGSRADTDYVRTGREKATVTMIVETDDVEMDTILEEAGVPEEDTLILQRQISAVGKSMCRVNGAIVPLSVLSRLCKRIADIHGQYDHQSLLNVENHLELLDLYGKQEIEPVRQMTADFFHGYEQSASALDQLQKRLADGERQKDLMRYELEEIRAAAILPGEDETLEEEIHLMQNSEKIFEVLTASYNALYADECSVSALLGKAVKDFSGIAEFSAQIQDISTGLNDAFYNLEDLGHTLRQYKDSLDFSVTEMEEKIARLDGLEKLKRKYGGSLESIFAYEAKAEKELEKIEHADEEIERLKRQKALFQEQLQAASARLRGLRIHYGKMLAEAITNELKELHFKDGVFAADIQTGPFSVKGIDRVEFLISANKGEDPKPLAKIASGGELSRIMLAMKRIIGDLDRIPTMIFDEIDSGISGATAGIVGKKLHEIAQNHQVLCITHLPQIAAFGRQHYRIEKISDEISTHTTVTPLDSQARIEEIARLLSGTIVTEQARASARELLTLSGDQC
ncbi:MAG: DNA repair protein RecN [Eubacteriales bacterium]|nr:DNA repair protein RecN [Eubacteriales bacterium]